MTLLDVQQLPQIRSCLSASLIGNEPMALGYVIALALIGAGSTLFVMGILRMRQEAMVRAEELKNFLKTGVSPVNPSPLTITPHPAARRREETLTLSAPRSPQAEATRALRRAYDDTCAASAAA